MEMRNDEGAEVSKRTGSSPNDERKKAPLFEQRGLPTHESN